MSDSNDMNLAEESAVVSVGQVLKTAREAQQLDIEDVCSYLRLSRRQVIALENNDFAVLPEATITRGFIRNYARMLELDAEPLLEAYRSFGSSHQPRSITIQSENILMPGSDKRSWAMYIVASVLIVLLVTAWVIYVDYIPKKTPAANESLPVATEQLPAEQAMAETESSVVALPEAESESTAVTTTEESASVTQDETVSNESISASVPSAAALAPVPAASAVPASGAQATIQLSASQRSWVSITDKNNKNIFDKIMVAGIDEVVRGEPPFEVVIGNAPNTTLLFNNQPVDLAPVTKDRVARLKLE